MNLLLNLYMVAEWETDGESRFGGGGEGEGEYIINWHRCHIVTMAAMTNNERALTKTIGSKQMKDKYR